jgi:NitT/TauT family transport system substrate-binding protein
MKRSLQIIIYALLIIFAASCKAGGANPDIHTFRIAYLPITHSAAVMAMGEAAKDSETGYAIELIRFSTWSEVVEALRTGRVDGASMLFEVALRAQESNGGLLLLSLSHRDGNVIVAAGDIHDYHDLVGRNVAIPHRLSPQYTLLHMVMEREGINIDDINVIEISPAEMPFSMASGLISAYFVAEPYGSVAVSTGVGRILETSDTIFPNAICCVLVFRRDSLPESAAGWLIGEFEAAASALNSDRDMAVDVFMKYTSFREAVVRESMNNIYFDNLRITKEEYYGIADTILGFGVLTAIPPFEGFVYKNHYGDEE